MQRAHLPFRFSCLLLVILLSSVSSLSRAATMQSSDVEKRAKYEQLKLPELVRRANANDAMAQFELGSRFNYGRNAPKSNAEGLRWLRRAAENGDSEAQRLLAVKLYNGYDVPVDQEEALRWAQRLAESGDVPGQMMAGNMHGNGEGTPRDLVRAYMWYDIAATVAQQGDGDPVLRQAAVDARDKTGALLLPDEETRAQELASSWWLRKQGVSLAPKAKPKPGKATGKPSAQKKADILKPAGKTKDAEKPKLPGAPEAPLKPEAKKP